MYKTYISKTERKVVMIREVCSPILSKGLMPADLGILARAIYNNFHPGLKIRITVEKYDDPPELNKKVVAYWFKEIITKIREGLFETGVCMNDRGTQSWLIGHLDDDASLSTDLLKKFASAIQIDTATGIIQEVIPVISSMKPGELQRLFDPIIAWASEHLHVQIVQLSDYAPA